VRAHLHQRAADLDLGQYLARDGAGRDPRGSLARRGTAAAAIIAQAVFGLIGEVGMAGTKLVLDLGIVFGASVFSINSAIGVPVVTCTPVSGCAITPDRILTASASWRWVVKRDCPGRRRSRSRWMSASTSGISGGQPSTTQPIAIPWLSPKVVTRNMWPKVLKDIDAVNNYQKRCMSTFRRPLS